MTTTSGLLLHTSSSVATNNVDLFSDFSSNTCIRDSTTTSTVDDDGESRPKIDGEVAVADTTPAFGHTTNNGDEANVGKEVAEALIEIENIFAQLVAGMGGYDIMEAMSMSATARGVDAV